MRGWGPVRLAALTLSAAVLSGVHQRSGTVVMAVDRNKFRKCSDTGFCKRNRGRQPPQTPFVVDPASIVRDEAGLSATIIPGDGGGSGGGGGPLSLRVVLYDNGACRVRVTEAPPTTPRWEPLEVVMEEQLRPATYKVVPAGDPSLPPALRSVTADQGLHLEYGGGVQDGSQLLSLRFRPFGAELFVDGHPAVSANKRGLMHFEQRRERGPGNQPAGGRARAKKKAVDIDLHGGKKVMDYGEDGLAIYDDGTHETPEDHHRRRLREAEEEEEEEQEGEDESGHHEERALGMWEETFDGHPDTKPHGPMSVGMDIAFPGSEHVYGIPEHATAMSLKATAGAGAPYAEPYRLYTLDVFQYELDDPMALYGTIPLVLSHKRLTEEVQTPPTTTVTSGALWLNPTETFVDVSSGDGDGGGGGEGEEGASVKWTHWISEGGVVDLWLLGGKRPSKVLEQYSDITGKPELPPVFALGFHQCRWNYRDEKDVLAVDQGFEDLDFPYDVIWLDIEHTDGKRYFTWNKELFPDPPRMIEKIAGHGRRMVTIVDPHMKRDNAYHVHKEATAKGYYIKDKDGKDFDGWCWPGSSSYLDFTDAMVRAWWASLFSLEKYVGSTLDLYTWNDMNEPSVFNGPEVSMKKDCLSLAGVEHRHWHNLYGMYMHRATAEGLVERHKDKQGRPFVLSRAFFSGSQRWGAIWTGDNAAKWDHLAISAPMLLSMGLAGLPFVGADVGGFFGDPSAELFLRWMQAGAYQPFFRSHAHHDSKRREPWTFGDPWTGLIRQAVLARYSLLPYWYTLFAEANRSGMPVMRPMFWHYPDDPKTFAMDDQWLVGSDLLVKPVTSQGQTTVSVYLPSGASCLSTGLGGQHLPQGGGLWYDVDTMRAVPVGKGEEEASVEVDAPLDKVPVFQRGGSIIPRKARLRRCSRLMHADPYTLVVALDAHGNAQGELYLDDEETFAYRDKGEEGSALRLFAYSDGSLKSTGSGGYRPTNTIERVIVAGLLERPAGATLLSGGDETSLDVEYDQDSGVATVRKPGALVGEDFEIRLVPGPAPGAVES